MADNTNISLAAEFQALPLESIIAAPLKGAIEAQAVAAATTKAFIDSMIDKDGKPVNVHFKIARNSADASGTAKTEASIDVPLLSMVPIPHLRIDSITTHFKYEISLAEKKEKEFGWGVDVQAGTTGLLAKFVSVSLKGNVSSKSREESVMNRSGMLEITVHASESPMPEGLAKILNLLSSTIPSPVDQLPAAGPKPAPKP
jgi:hypothetical protein